MSKTVVVTLTDKNYWDKAKRTIIDVRSRGEYTGDLVLISVDFNAPKNFLDFYNVTERKVTHINTDLLLEQYNKFPFIFPGDGRHLTKLNQWDKFYAFDLYFKQWNKVIFFDAGLRILDKIKILEDIPCQGTILAPDDTFKDPTKSFGLMLDVHANPNATEKLFEEYSRDILREKYFLNCIWVYDTSLLDLCNISHLICAMNSYPICRCNEMSIMNLLFTMKHKVWMPFPEFIEGGKRLFGWTEHDKDYGQNKSWRDFCFMKYPVTINFECE